MNKLKFVTKLAFWKGPSDQRVINPNSIKRAELHARL